MIIPCRCTGCSKVRIFQAWQRGLLWRIHWRDVTANVVECGHAEYLDGDGPKAVS